MWFVFVLIFSVFGVDVDPLADVNCSSPCNKAIDLFFAIDTSASLSPQEMGSMRQFMKQLLPLLAIAPGDDTKVEIGISFFWIHNGVVLPFTDDTTVAKALSIIEDEFACDTKNTLNISVPPFKYPCGPQPESCCQLHQGTSISLGLQEAAKYLSTNPGRRNAAPVIVTITDGCHNTRAFADTCTGTHPEAAYKNCVDDNGCNIANPNGANGCLTDIRNTMTAARRLVPNAQWFAIYVAKDRCDNDLAMLDIMADAGNVYFVNNSNLLPKLAVNVVNDICNSQPGPPRCTPAPTAVPTRAPTPPTAAPVDSRNCTAPCNKAIDLFLAIDTSASLNPTEMADLRAFVKGMLPLLAIAPGDDTKVELGISFFWIHSGVILPFTDDTTVEKASAIIDKEFICDAKVVLNISVPPFAYPCIPIETQCCSGHQGTSISLGIREAAKYMATNPAKRDATPIIMTFTDGCHNTFVTGDACTSAFPDPNYIQCVSDNFCDRVNVNAPKGCNTDVRNTMATARALIPQAQWYAIYVARDRCDYDEEMLQIISDPGNIFVVNNTKILPQLVNEVVNDVCNALPGPQRCDTNAPTRAPTREPTRAPTPPTKAPTAPTVAPTLATPAPTNPTPAPVTQSPTPPTDAPTPEPTTEAPPTFFPTAPLPTDAPTDPPTDPLPTEPPPPTAPTDSPAPTAPIAPRPTEVPCNVRCNDNNLCTTDSCVPSGGCEFKPVVCSQDSAIFGLNCTLTQCNETSGRCDNITNACPSQGLSAGAAAGIAVGVTAGVAVVAAGVLAAFKFGGGAAASAGLGGMSQSANVFESGIHSSATQIGSNPMHGGEEYFSL